ncbi:MAG TPA: hypothetical protein PLB50_08000 [Candidatus Saccharicenans sp.]|jgi:hypothetical protein|nr:hypothetical protein [Candidatus Saccharicenans sp.]HQO76609.1 hypothetical protein [Candidatus Saccharicenans sp.]HUM79697.1 hypothetical protein [Candidatus Saccharicenans sp.]
MKEEKWQEELERYFQGLRIIDKSQEEAREHFDQFCEFIVEPAVEALEDKLKQHGIKIKYWHQKYSCFHLQINFPGSKVANFHYVISLPKNSLDLKLSLKTFGRKDKNSPVSGGKEGPFLPGVKPEVILKLGKEDIILDIISHLKEFNYTARTSPD